MCSRAVFKVTDPGPVARRDLGSALATAPTELTSLVDPAPMTTLASTRMPAIFARTRVFEPAWAGPVVAVTKVCVRALPPIDPPESSGCAFSLAAPMPPLMKSFSVMSPVL